MRNARDRCVPRVSCVHSDVTTDKLLQQETKNPPTVNEREFSLFPIVAEMDSANSRTDDDELRVSNRERLYGAMQASVDSINEIVQLSLDYPLQERLAKKLGGISPEKFRKTFRDLFWELISLRHNLGAETSDVEEAHLFMVSIVPEIPEKKPKRSGPFRSKVRSEV